MNGDFGILEWAINKGCPLADDICECVAEYKQYDMLKHLIINHKCKLSASVLANVIRYDHTNIEMIEWLIYNGCPLGTVVFEQAAYEGDIQLMILLKENGCEFDENTCKFALYNEQFEALQWLIDNECPCEDEILAILEERSCI